MRQPEAADGHHPFELTADVGQLRIVERDEPPVIELDACRAVLSRERDEAAQAKRTEICAIAPEPLQACRVGQAVGVQTDAKR
jgi:hypothetical protein